MSGTTLIVFLLGAVHFVTGWSLLLGAVATTLAVFSFAPPAQPAAPKTFQAGRFTWALIGVAVLLALLQALSTPPRGYDPLWFQLPIAQSILQTESLIPTQDLRWFWHPGNANVWMAGTLALLPERAVNLLPIPFLLLTSLVTLRIAAHLHPDAQTESVATWIITTPCFFFLSTTAHTDIFAIALLTLAIYWWMTERPFLCFLTLGLALGTKVSVLPAASILVVGALLQRPKQAAKALPLILLTFAFWPLRSWILMGDPLFPIEPGTLPSPGKEAELLGGEPWRWLIFFALPAPYSHEWGLGLVPGLLAVLGLPLLPWSRSSRLLSAVIGVHLIAWWLGSRQFRHLIVVYPLALALGAGMLSKMPRLTRIWPIVALVVLLRISFFVDRFGMNVEPLPDRTTFYGLPPDWDTKLPCGATVQNRIGQPHNYPLAGANLCYRVVGFDEPLTGDYAVTLSERVPRLPGYRQIDTWQPAPFRWWGLFRARRPIGRIWKKATSPLP